MATAGRRVVFLGLTSICISDDSMISNRNRASFHRQAATSSSSTMTIKHQSQNPYILMLSEALLLGEHSRSA
jgi:hypothetical protein